MGTRCVGLGIQPAKYGRFRSFQCGACEKIRRSEWQFKSPWTNEMHCWQYT